MRVRSWVLAALAALAVVPLSAPATGAAHDPPAGYAKKGKKKCGKKKPKKAVAAAGKKKGKKKCGKPAPAPSPAPSPAPVTPSGDTRITLSTYIAGAMTDQIVGSVASTNAACATGRTLTLYEETGAVDELRGTATVTGGGVTFSFPRQDNLNSFYAVAQAETVGGVSCAAGTSNVIQKNFA